MQKFSDKSISKMEYFLFSKFELSCAAFTFVKIKQIGNQIDQIYFFQSPQMSLLEST